MKDWIRRPLRWLAWSVCCAAALVGCGGGGGGTDGTGSLVAPPVGDARNGDYVMYAADAREYTLSLDFDAGTYRVAGNGQDLAGTIRAGGAAGQFDFDNATPSAAAPGAPRFAWFSDTVVGGFRFPAGTVPFIASRSFVGSLGEAAGTYNYLATYLDTAAPPENAIYSGELLASGTLRICQDVVIYRISSCPASSVVTGTVTVSGNQFKVDNGTVVYPFRIAKVGSDRVFLRASASTGTSRRFIVGLPATASFADGSFEGQNNNGQATATSFAGTTYSGTWSSGVSSTMRTGTIYSFSGTTGPGGIAFIDGGANGAFFSISNSALMALVAARGSTAWPGYVEIGRR